jgi:hypothetical protein
MKTTWTRTEMDDRIHHTIEIAEGRVRVQWYDTCSNEQAWMGYEQTDFPIAEFLAEGSPGRAKVQSDWGEATLAEVLQSLQPSAR